MPGVPTKAVASLAGTQVVVSWTAPTSNGGSPITGYTVTVTPDGATATTTGALSVHSQRVDQRHHLHVHGDRDQLGAAPALHRRASNAVVAGVPADGARCADGGLVGTRQRPGVADLDRTGVQRRQSRSPATPSPPPPAAPPQPPPTRPATVTGLTNGTAYTFTVTATNAIGTSPPSAVSNTVTPANVPGAPTNVVAVAGDGLATVSWRAPTNTGGVPITSYVVTAFPGGATTSTTGALTVTFGGLSNGTSYTFTVAAVNAAGTSTASKASAAVTPAGLPLAPTNVLAVAGDGQVSVSWSPASDNGSAITGYTVTVAPGGTSVSTTAAVNVVFPSLTNGVSYTFTVVARNAIGTGAASAPSAPVVPSQDAGAPTNVTGVVGDGQVALSWTPPLSSRTVSHYVVTVSPGNVNLSTTSSTLTVTNLTDGSPYTFVVTVYYTDGTNVASAPSAALTPVGLPGAPTAVAAVAGDSEVTLSWDVPTKDGGSPIIEYNVIDCYDPSVQLATGTSNPSATVAGLINGNPYSFAVAAITAVGTSAASACSAQVIPSGVPSPPVNVNVAPINQAVELTWQNGSDGGSPITGYILVAEPGDLTRTVTISDASNWICETSYYGGGGDSNAPPGVVPPTCSDPNQTAVWIGLQYTFDGLTNGTSYSFTIAAINANGTSSPSTIVTAEPNPIPPGAPTITASSLSGGTFTMAWNPPADDGGDPITSYNITLGDSGDGYCNCGTAPVGETVDATQTTITFSGLLPNSLYGASVSAVTAAGIGAPATSGGLEGGTQDPVQSKTVTIAANAAGVQTISVPGHSLVSSIVDADSSLYFTDPNNPGVFRYDPIGNSATTAIGAGAFMAVCPADGGSGSLQTRVLVADASFLYVYLVCADGRTSIVGASILSGQVEITFSRPQGGSMDTVGPDGYIYGATNGSLTKWIPGLSFEGNFVDYIAGGVRLGVVAAAADNSDLWLIAQSGIYSLVPGDNVAELASPSEPFGGYPVVSAGRYLYGFGRSTGGDSLLVRFDKTSGESVVVAATGVPSGNTSLASDGSNLWFTNQNSLYAVVAMSGPSLHKETRGGSNPSEKPAGCSCADPVDPMTGALTQSVTDISVPARGVGLSWSRSYDSQDAATVGRLGAGWADNYGVSVVADPSANTTDITSASAVDVVQENGSLVVFNRNTDGSYSAATRVLGTLTRNGDGSWTFTRQARSIFTFDSTGRLVSETSLTGEGLSLSYSAGRLAHVTDGAGRSLTFAYGSNGLVSSVTDPAGRSTTYGYNGAGDLTSVTDPAGAITRYGYDASGRITTETNAVGGVTTTSYDANGWADAQTDPRGKTTTFSYSSEDGSGTVTTTMTDPLGYRTVLSFGNGDLVAKTTGAGTAAAATTSYLYDPTTNGLIETIDPDGHASTATYDAAGHELSATDADGHTTRWSYDSLGDVVSTTDPLGVTQTATFNSYGEPTGSSVPNGATTVTTSMAYADAAHPGDLTSRADAGSHVTTYGYDANGDVASTTNATGGTTTFTYDADGWLASQVSPDGSAAGAIASAYTTTFAHDGDGRVTATTDPLGRTTASTYDGDGNLLTSTDAGGRVTRNTYDLAGHLLSTVAPDGSVVNKSYDGDGRLASVDDGAGHTSTTTHDAAGDVLTTTDPAGGTTTNVYGRGGRLLSTTTPNGGSTSYSYDPAGLLLTATDPDGGITRHVYDVDGRLTATTDANGHTTSTTYDALGNPTQTTAADGSTTTRTYNALSQLVTQTNAVGAVTHYTYDADGREVSVTDPDGRTTTYGYDASGNATSTTDASGRQTTVTYNASNQPTTVAYSDSGTASVSYNYASDGQLSTTVDGTGTTTYTYDAAGRPHTVVDGSGASVGYGYNSLGQESGITYPDGRQVARTYDANGRLASVSDWNGQTTQFGYDGDGNNTSITYPDGTTDSVGVDAADRVTAVQTTAAGPPGAAAVLASFGYTNSPTGQVVSTADSLVGNTVSFGYDAADRLTTDSATGAGYSYDHANELTGLSDGSQLSYDPAGQLLASTPTTGTATSYTFDGVGDRTGSTDPTSATYAYDQNDSLTSVTNATGTWSYTYNGAGLRVDQTGTSSAHFVWDGLTDSLPLLLTDGADDYVYGPGGRVVEQQPVGGGAVAYLHADASGSVRLLTDASGSVTSTATYDAYGQVVSSTGTTTSRFGFAGQYTDPSGLQYLRARIYDPATGQFLTVDPLVATTGEPYAYSNDDPINGVDPSGLRSWWSHGFGSALLRGAVDLNNLNPFNGVVGDYKKEIRSVEKGCGVLRSISYGLEGTGDAVIQTAMLAGGEAEADIVGVAIDDAATATTRVATTDVAKEAADDTAQSAVAEDGQNAAADEETSAASPPPTAPTLFRGTSEGFEGGQGALQSGITPASTDPQVATAFATHAEQFGPGVLHIASPEDLAGLKVELGAGYLPYEAEALVGTTPAEFAARAGLTVSSSAARSVLNDMGIFVPGQIGTAGDLTAFLRGSPQMSSEQIAEFLTRIGG